MTTIDQLKLFGARQNNLQGFDLVIDHHKFVAITGISGSGKSTLAFDTIYAEGQRRYVETFSPYTRQFLERLPEPELNGMSGVRPALALSQQSRVTTSRSTVGTITEINDFLKVIWADIGRLHCPNCNTNIDTYSTSQVVERIPKLFLLGELEHLIIAFPLPLQGKASVESLRQTLTEQGLLRFVRRPSTIAVGETAAQGTIERIETLRCSDVNLENEHLIVVVDRIKMKGEISVNSQNKERLTSSVQQAFNFGNDEIIILRCSSAGVVAQETHFSKRPICQVCRRTFPAAKPALFSFNSPLGACPCCKGFGKILAVDRARCIPNPEQSIDRGAVICWATPATRHEYRALKKFCQDNNIETNIPWKSLKPAAQELVFCGTGKKGYRGIEGWFQRLQRKIYKMHVRVLLSRYRGEFQCPKCQGKRLRPEALIYRVEGKTLPDIWNIPLSDLHSFITLLAPKKINEQHVSTAFAELESRLQFLVEIGLGYLTLNRQSRSLSGGELQRVNLTTLLGAQLVNTMIVLDEPSIGLHSRDSGRLLGIIRKLRDQGNTILVVEHDAEIISQADEIIDLGPKAARDGGAVIFQGKVSDLKGHPLSLTAQYLFANKPQQSLNLKNNPGPKQFLELHGAAANNLKDVSVQIPLNCFVVVTGVSGSGKSSLIRDCLFAAYQRLRVGNSLEGLPVQQLLGVKLLTGMSLIDQSPVGKTPRSNPGTFTKVWEIFRSAFAKTVQAEKLGLTPSFFSFNVDGGRCPVCKGSGQIRIEMQFLADVFIECEQCSGKRFQPQVLEVRLNDQNITDCLTMGIEEARAWSSSLGASEHQLVGIRLKPLIDLGLGYLRLGQPLNTLSGGEAQRLKLAKYLLDQSTTKHLFILDEPTTGLHPHDVQNLMTCLRRLIEHGHSVLCIEHNLDVIQHADWMIDLGPDGGEQGGHIIATGNPSELIHQTELFNKSATLHLLHSRSERVEPKVKRQDKRRPSATPPHIPPPIRIVGAREHNLKNISLALNKNKFLVITGVSGSGKSTLAFDILFSEGQRRYIDSLSPYARQYITNLQKPDVDAVLSIPPTIAVSQKTAPPLGVSTIATTTEIYQYLRLLYAKTGTLHCPDHNVPITRSTSESITNELLERYKNGRVFLFAPIISGRKGRYRDLFERALRAEISEARIDGKIFPVHSELRLERHKLHWISLLVASFSKLEGNRDLLHQAVEQCLVLGSGVLEVSIGQKNTKPQLYSTERVCPICKTGFRQLDPQDFSFRSSRGACQVCRGYGVITQARALPAKVPCPSCHGARISGLGRHVLLGGKTIFEITQLTAPQLQSFLQNLKYDSRLSPILLPILRELEHRLQIISAIGLDYLSLDRESSSISGGEAQRLRLACTLGSPLTGVCYVFDEPTIGLHPQDHQRLLQTLTQLRDRGNTIVVVEHDEETILAADEIIDVGPGGGTAGGEIVAQGTLLEILRAPMSTTGKALRERLSTTFSLPPPTTLARKNERFLVLRGIATNNLKNVAVSLPLGRLTVVCGVSGAGKSSLVRETLLPTLSAALHKEKRKTVGAVTEIEGWEVLQRCFEIDQMPVGKTSSSTPASYLGLFDQVRKLYALLPEALARGWKASHFSFNTVGGRCESCRGKGHLRIPMSFLPDAVSICEECNGSRYQETTREVTFQGHSIADVLNKTFVEARELFANHRQIRRALDYVHHLGIGYLTLGQPTHSLSGGEAQRLKIARELSSREATATLYVFDEPSTGLHMVDVDKLICVLHELLAKGNTVVVIEHNLDFISAADYVIELGPGPGERGGSVIFSGDPQMLMTAKTPTQQALVQRRWAFQHHYQQLVASENQGRIGNG